MKKIFLFIFLSSCVVPNSDISTNKKSFEFNKNLNFDEFHQLLIKYADSSSYPDINN